MNMKKLSLLFVTLFVALTMSAQRYSNTPLRQIIPTVADEALGGGGARYLRNELQYRGFKLLPIWGIEYLTQTLRF